MNCALEKGQGSPQRRPPREGNGAIAGNRTEGASPGVALAALAGQLCVAAGAVSNDAQTILKSALAVRGVRSICEGACRQQDLQSYRQNEKHSRDPVASHLFSSAHFGRHELRIPQLSMQLKLCAAFDFFARFMTGCNSLDCVGRDESEALWWRRFRLEALLGQPRGRGQRRRRYSPDSDLPSTERCKTLAAPHVLRITGYWPYKNESVTFLPH
jgi:hypothetical protein